jgi:hypothetical protein
MVGQWVTQIEDGKVAAKRVLQPARGGPADRGKEGDRGGTIIVRSSCKVRMDDFLSIDFPGLLRYSDVISGSDKTTFWVYAKAVSEFAFYADTLQLQFQLQLSDGKDSLVEVLGMSPR